MCFAVALLEILNSCVKTHEFGSCRPERWLDLLLLLKNNVRHYLLGVGRNPLAATMYVTVKYGSTQR